MQYNFKDRTGERYGILTVLERAENAVFPSGKLVQWKCLCDCGKIVTVIGSNLVKMKSCGCQIQKKQAENLTGKKFGLLTATRRVRNNITPKGQSQTMWECQCECGSIVNVRAAHLKDGLTLSCGCLKSKREKTIAEKLTENNIKYKREVTFADLVNKNCNLVYFDFAIYNDTNKLVCLIEHQGKQHYQDIDFGRMQREETDELKRKYCKERNIQLYELSYLEDIDIFIDQLLLFLHDNTVPGVSDNKGVTTIS